MAEEVRTQDASRENGCLTDLQQPQTFHEHVLAPIDNTIQRPLPPAVVVPTPTSTSSTVLRDPSSILGDSTSSLARNIAQHQATISAVHPAHGGDVHTVSDCVERTLHQSVITKPLPQSQPQGAVSKIIARVDGPSLKAHDHGSTNFSTLIASRSASTCLTRSSVGPRLRGGSSSWDGEADTFPTDHAAALYDGDDCQNTTPGSGYVGSTSLESASQELVHDRQQHGSLFGRRLRPLRSAEHQPTSADHTHGELGERDSHTSHKKSRVSPGSGLFPCVFHDYGLGPDPTENCAIRRTLVFRLRSHHECATHNFFYCTTCFKDFVSKDARDAHNPRNCTNFKCVTDDCVHYGTFPVQRCYHDRDGKPLRAGNTQRGIWRALFSLARPSELVPEVAANPDLISSPWPSSPVAPLPPMQAPAEATTQFVPRPDAVSQGTYLSHAQMDTTSLAGSSTMTPFDLTSRTGLLRCRVLDLQALSTSLWQQAKDPTPGRLAMLRSFCSASLDHQPPSASSEEGEDSDLRGRVRVLHNLASQLWTYVDGSQLSDQSGVATLFQLASQILGQPGNRHMGHTLLCDAGSASDSASMLFGNPNVGFELFSSGVEPSEEVSLNSSQASHGAYSNLDTMQYEDTHHQPLLHTAPWPSTQNPLETSHNVPLGSNSAQPQSDYVDPQMLDLIGDGPGMESRAPRYMPNTYSDSVSAYIRASQRASNRKRSRSPPQDSMYSTPVGHEDPA